MSNDSCGAPAGGVTITKDKAVKEAVVEGHVLNGGTPVSTGYARLLGTGAAALTNPLATSVLARESVDLMILPTSSSTCGRSAGSRRFGKNQNLYHQNSTQIEPTD